MKVIAIAFSYGERARSDKKRFGALSCCGVQSYMVINKVASHILYSLVEEQEIPASSYSVIVESGESTEASAS